MSRVRGFGGTLGSGSRPITSSQMYSRMGSVVLFHFSADEKSPRDQNANRFCSDFRIKVCVCATS